LTGSRFSDTDIVVYHALIADTGSLYVIAAVE
jgi:hypothetical protein